MFEDNGIAIGFREDQGGTAFTLFPGKGGRRWVRRSDPQGRTPDRVGGLTPARGAHDAGAGEVGRGGAREAGGPRRGVSHARRVRIQVCAAPRARR